MTQCPKCHLSPCRCIVADGERIVVSMAMADAAARGDDPNGQEAYERRLAESWKADPAYVGFEPKVPAGLSPQAAYERRVGEAWKVRPAVEA